MCVRTQGGVSLLCRMMVMGTVVQKTMFIARLPYSETLRLISTGGKTYDRWRSDRVVIRYFSLCESNLAIR